MNDLRDRLGQVIHFYGSSGHKPRFSKIISTEDDLPKPPDKGWLPLAPWTSYLSHHLQPFIPTWEYGCCLHSPYSPGIVQLLQKGDQVQLRAHRTCSSEKGIFVFQRLISVQSNKCSVETRTREKMLIQPGKWFPQILYSNHLCNTNKYITSDPEILIKYYEGKVCNCEIKKRCTYLMLGVPI